MYNNIDVNCRYPDCKKLKKLIEIEEHELNCTAAKCLNYELCENLVKSVIFIIKFVSILYSPKYYRQY